MIRRIPFHPLLLGVYPVIALYAINSSELALSDLWRPMAMALVGTLLLWGLLQLIFRDAKLSAVVTTITALGSLLFGNLWQIASVIPIFGRRAHFFLFWMLAGLVILVLLCRKREAARKLSEILNVFGVILFAMALVHLAVQTPLYHPSEVSAGSKNPSDSAKFPDIFLIVLDGYGRSDLLKEAMGYSNHEFLEGLTKRGFKVASKSNSNYGQTELSLSSTLNMDYVQNVLGPMPKASRDVRPLIKRVDHSVVSTLLRKHGYSYVAISSGGNGLRYDSADKVYTQQGGPSPFEAMLIQNMPLPIFWIGIDDHHRDRVISALTTLGEMGRTADQPKFVIAHILSPHPPFVFGPNGEPRTPESLSLADGKAFMESGGTPEKYKKGYADQATHLSRQVLIAIDKIRATSKVPPIILIQGDHGSRLNVGAGLDDTDITELFSNLNACLAPEPIQKRFSDRAASVNTFRIVFSELFKENLPELPNRIYYSPNSAPYDFTDVTDMYNQQS